MVSVFIILSIFWSGVCCDLFALLWAGIFPYDDLGYAAEASMYQAYHQLIQNGVNPENIITFGMDIAAHNKKNPYPGQVFAYPGGPNVYEGFKFDYIFRDNTPENIIKVLNNEDMTGIGSGRTFKTTSEDDILIASFNHGGPECLAFIYDEYWMDCKYLISQDLATNLTQMYKKGLYRDIVFFMTACQSGSMFFPIMNQTQHVYALTAAPPPFDAIACYNDNGSIPYMNSCFAKWWQMYAREAAADQTLFQKTIEDTYRFAFDHMQPPQSWFNETYCEYGDAKLKDTFLGRFLKGSSSPSSSSYSSPSSSSSTSSSFKECKSFNEVVYSKNIQKKKYWERLREIFGSSSENHSNLPYDPKTCYEKAPMPNFHHYSRISNKGTCFERVSSHFDEKCENLQFYDLSNLRILWNACEQEKEENIIEILDSICK